MNTLAELLFSRGKAEIFRLLFGVIPRELHVREIERQSGLADATAPAGTQDEPAKREPHLAGLWTRRLAAQRPACDAVCAARRFLNLIHFEHMMADRSSLLSIAGRSDYSSFHADS